MYPVGTLVCSFSLLNPLLLFSPAGTGYRTVWLTAYSFDSSASPLLKFTNFVSASKRRTDWTSNGSSRWNLDNQIFWVRTTDKLIVSILWRGTENAGKRVKWSTENRIRPLATTCCTLWFDFCPYCPSFSTRCTAIVMLYIGNVDTNYRKSWMTGRNIGILTLQWKSSRK